MTRPAITSEAVFNLPALIEAVVRSDDFVEKIAESVDFSMEAFIADGGKFSKAVQTVVREEMANDILEILVSEADIFSSDEFKDSVTDILDDKIDRKIEREVDGISFEGMIRDALPDLTDLEARLAEREKELLIAFKGLKDLNAEIKLYQQDQLKLFANFWSLIQRLRRVWIIGRFFYW